MHVCLHEIEPRPLVYIAQSWDPNFAVELGCEYRPVRVWILPDTYTWTGGGTNLLSEADIGEETANSQVNVLKSLLVCDIAELVRLILVQLREGKVLRSRQKNKWSRWALIEARWVAVGCSGLLRFGLPSPSCPWQESQYLHHNCRSAHEHHPLAFAQDATLRKIFRFQARTDAADLIRRRLGSEWRTGI